MTLQQNYDNNVMFYGRRGSDTYGPSSYEFKPRISPGNGPVPAPSFGTLFSAKNHFGRVPQRPPYKPNAKPKPPLKPQTVQAAVEDLHLPGFSHITEHKSSWKVRILWALVSGSILLLCIYQCCERVHYFFNGEPAMNTLLYDNLTVPFPVVTICPAEPNFRNPSVEPYLLKELYPNVTEFNTVYDLMEKTQMSIATLWNISRIVTNSTRFALSYGISLANGFQDGPSFLDVQEIFTTSGICFMVKAKTDVVHQGIHTYMLLEGLGDVISSEFTQYYRVSYTAEPEVPLMRYFYPIQAFFSPLTSMNLIMLRLEEVRLLNLWQKPCRDGEAITKCLITCIEKKIFSQVEKPCRLPYMDFPSTVPECVTVAEFRDVFNATDEVVKTFRPESCNPTCPRLCREVIYRVESFSQRQLKYPFIFQVWIYIPESRLAVTQEAIIYSTMALFSDVGGGLGFFLGICALQIIEILAVCVTGMAKKIGVAF